MRGFVILGVVLLAIAVGDLSLAVARGVPCRAKIDEIVCTDDPDCKWNANKSKCDKAKRGNDPCSDYESEFYCKANKCHWHRLASKCSTKPSRPY
jgi:hypothetical protein